MKYFILSWLIVTSACILVGCMEKPEYEIKENIIEMELSKPYWIEDQSLSYLGMINENTFSMSHTGRAAVNVFFPTNVTEFSLYRHNFTLKCIKPNSIILSYLTNETLE